MRIRYFKSLIFNPNYTYISMCILFVFEELSRILYRGEKTVPKLHLTDHSRENLSEGRTVRALHISHVRRVKSRSSRLKIERTAPCFSVEDRLTCFPSTISAGTSTFFTSVLHPLLTGLHTPTRRLGALGASSPCILKRLRAYSTT